MNYKEQLNKVKEFKINVHSLNVALEVERLDLGEEDFEKVCAYVSEYDLKSSTSTSIIVEIVNSIETALGNDVWLERILENHWNDLYKLSEDEEDEEDYFQRLIEEIATQENCFWVIGHSDNRDCTSETYQYFYGTAEDAQEFSEGNYDSEVQRAIENYDYEREYNLEEDEEPTDDMIEEAEHECEECIETWYDKCVNWQDLAYELCGGYDDFNKEIEKVALELGIIKKRRG